MTEDNPLHRLTQMSALLLEARTAKLREAAAAREALRAQLQALDQAAAPGDDPAIQRAALLYEAWAATRRADINQALARRQADWLQELDSARRAFGRDQVLRQLCTEKPARRD